jgi:hypothetical protein
MPESWHECPGGCGAQVRRTVLSCAPCWRRLPLNMRTPIQQAYRRPGRGGRMAYLRLVSEAIQWFRQNSS